ncbi:S-adenosyl-L-methionine-dependent methyltransferase [Chaetomium fimeti]|uniref:S-adenosyl-L-methionine-dependent methyltransferase n=1 Tax=Chaetomium fimeti TaxID=1854472 RepID=A0AAE0LVR6_9PEZI|nr:S-adenosyl-L-methionine-dependent methyltransferase [Chaetomium fimeti]
MSDVEEALTKPEYWDEHYTKSDGQAPTHEWFRSFADLEEFFQTSLFEAPGRTVADDPVILHLGSGDSVIPLEFDSRGYRRQVCVDFSPRIVEMMTERHRDVSGIEWRRMDVRNMAEVADKSIGVAFDKGTLDAMIHGSPWSPPPDVRDNTSRYLAEVHRVLSDDGVFLYVTFRQPHFMRSLLNQQDLWDLDLQILGTNNGGFEYYGWVIRKATSKEQKP